MNVMHTRRSPRSAPIQAALLLSLAGLALPAIAQEQPRPGNGPAVERGNLDPEMVRAGRPQATNGRRVVEGPPTKLAFNNVAVSEILPFIVAATGKVVMPQQDVLTYKVTVLNDQEIPRAQALDMVLMALQQRGVAVVETDTIITLRDISEITRQAVPVLGPDESSLERTDVGTIAEKVYRLTYSSAENYGEILKGALPDYAKLTVDKDSNQVAIMGNIALLQRMELLINSLDRPAAGALSTETFVLRYADAEQIAENITELYESSPTTGRGNQGRGQNNRNQQQNQPFMRFGGPGGGEQSASTSAEIRVSSNPQQNSVTVVADKAVIEQIRYQIDTYWDRPLPPDVVVPKIYDLQNTDAVKVRDLLEGLFGRGTPGASGGGQTGGGGQNGGNRQQGGASTATTQGIGRLAGQFSFEAIPEANRLVVVAKSPENIEAIDKIIADLDRVQVAGLPAIVELKHASAEDLAEQLNTLLAQDGTLAQIRRAEAGLTSSSQTNASPFATQQDATGQQQQEPTTSPDNIAFWWQRSRPPTDQRAASNLIAQVRLVPVWRQNAIMILAPVEYRNSIVKLVEDLDRPGRQVLLSAIVAEVQRDDATALGLRWSSQPLTPTSADNSISIGSDASGADNNFARSLFDTSVLNVNANLNVLLQALAQKTALTILSEPKVFTSDNQEAEFFSGQDIPFVTDSQITDQGNVIQSFDYRAVGIALRVRPRITIKRDVDLRVNVELSSIVPGQTLFGGFIVDRRETTTQVIIENGQTIVISGLLRSENSDIVRKVPLLGDIPLLGAIFRSREKTKRNVELLIFITPVVVDNPDESREVNEPYRQRLEEQFRPAVTDPKPAPELRGSEPLPPRPEPREARTEPAEQQNGPRREPYFPE